jgi:hypothetical protein
MCRCVSEGRSRERQARGECRSRSDTSAKTGSKWGHWNEKISKQIVTPLSIVALPSAGRGQTLAVLDEHRLSRQFGRPRTAVLLTRCTSAPWYKVRRQPAGHSRFLHNPYTQLGEAQSAVWMFNMTRGATRKRWDATRWITGLLFRTALLRTCGSYAGTGLPSDRNGGVSAWIRSTTMIPTDMIPTDERKWSASVHRSLGEGPSDAAELVFGTTGHCVHWASVSRDARLLIPIGGRDIKEPGWCRY